MSTQGLVSVVANGKVKFKVIAFSDGDRMTQVKDWLIGNPEASKADLWSFLLQLFDKDSLVLQFGKHEFIHEFPEHLEWTPNNLYQDKFNEPCYYPCLEFDTADYTFVIDIVDSNDGDMVERDLESFWEAKYAAKISNESSEDVELQQKVISEECSFDPIFKNEMKEYLSDLLEMEESGKQTGNDGYVSGLQYARINLETVLEKYGISRLTTIEAEV